MKRLIASLTAMLFVLTGFGAFAAEPAEIMIDEVLDGAAAVEPVEDVDTAEEIFTEPEITAEDDAELMSAMPVFLEQDFTKWSSGELTEASTGIGTVTEEGDTGHNVICSVSGAALRMESHGTNATDSVTFNGISGIEGKNTVTSFKLKSDSVNVTAGDVQRNIYIAGDTAYKILMLNNNTGAVTAPESSHLGKAMGYSTLSQPTKDNNDYYNITIEFYKGEYSGKKAWVIDMYDSLTETKFYTLYFAESCFPNGMTGVRFSTYRNAAARNAGVYPALTIENPVIQEMAEKPDLYVTDISHRGGQLEAGEKLITITFNKSVNPETLDGGLHFTKADGTAVKGGVYPQVQGNVVNLKFGRLEIGDYKLTIDSGLKNMDGGFAGEAEYNYTVTSLADSPYIRHDFSKWPDSSLDNAKLGIGTFVTGNAGGGLPSGASTPFEYSIEDGNALRLKTIGGAKAYRTEYFGFIANRDTAERDMAITFQMKANSVVSTGSGCYRAVSLATDAKGGHTELVRIDSGFTLTARATNNGAAAQTSLTQPSVGKDGYISLKISFRRELYNNKDCWGVHIYDANKDSSKVMSAYYPAEKFPSGVYGVVFNNYRDGQAVQNADDMSIYIKNPVMEAEGIKAAALLCSGDGAQPDIDEIKIVYDDEINAESFTKENVKLLNGDKELVMTFTADASLRQLIIMPADYLDYGGKYTVAVNDNGIADVEFTAAKRPVTVTGITLSGDTAAVSIDGTAGGDAEVILGMYSRQGEVLGFKRKALSTETVFTGVNDKAEALKVFIIEKNTGYMRKAGETYIYPDAE